MRRINILQPIWLGILGLLLGTAWLPGACRLEQNSRSAAGPATTEQKGVTSMSSLQMSVKPESQEVLIGTPLLVKIALTNVGQGVQQIPDTLNFSEFEFRLQPAGGGAERILSAQKAQATRNPDPAQPSPRNLIPLAPGAKQEYVEDLADYAIPPLAPGRYQLSAALPTAPGQPTSPSVPLAIVTPQVGSLATVPAPAIRSLGLVFSHLTASGEVDFYQQENRPNRVDDGIAQRRFGSAPPLPVGSVALAIELNPKPNGRWFAWLQGEAIGGGVGKGQAVFARHEPVALGFKTPSLQSVGWQPAIEISRFAAIGTDGQRRIAFAEAAFEVGDGGIVKVVPLAVTTMPVRWAASYRHSDAGGRYDVVTVSVSGQTTRVQRQTVVPTKGTADAVVLLAEREVPVVALALAPVAVNSPGVVDVLFGPVGENGQMTFLRLPLDGGAPLAEWKFNAPIDQNKQRPTAWTIASNPLPTPVVFAKLGNKLLVSKAAGGGVWKTLDENAAQADHLRLEVISDIVWAIWTEPVIGINYQQVQLP